MDKQQRAATSAPRRSDDFAHLSLGGLRRYRRALTQEEGRVSYWRRILQARLDLVQAAGRGVAQDVEHLRPMLAQTRIARGRQALVEVVPTQDIPPLPNLERLWERAARPEDPAYDAELVRDLVRAEAQLSAYRAALHRRIALATDELIARYREDPALCLSALPLPRNAARCGA